MFDLLALIAGQALEIALAKPKEAPASKAAQIAAQSPSKATGTPAARPAR